MPSGKTHEKLNHIVIYFIGLIMILLVSYYLYGKNGLINSSLAFIGFLFGTYFLSPDLDTKSRPYYRWGFLKGIWIPYRKFLAHRSFWSHGLLIGDAIRLLYLAFYLLALYVVIAFIFSIPIIQTLEQGIQIIRLHSYRYISFYLGLCFASFLHIISDYSVTYVKRKRKKKRSRI